MLVMYYKNVQIHRLFTTKLRIYLLDITHKIQTSELETKLSAFDP